MSLLKRLEKEKIQPNEESRNELRTARPIPTVDPWREFKSTVHHEVIQALDKVKDQDLTSETLHPMVEYALDARVAVLELTLPRVERQRLVQEIIDEILGFGPIEPLLQDPNVNEIMVNGPRQVYVERKGKLELSGSTFYDDAHVLHIIEKIVAPLGRRIDESQPMVDARLPDGSRVNAIIPPLSLNGPVLTIRKFSKIPFGMEDLVGFGTLTKDMADFINACVKA